MMRVLILTGWYPNGANKIKGVFVREQAGALRDAGLQVAVYYPFDEEVVAGTIRSEEEKGIWTYRANTNSLPNRYLSRLASYLGALRQLKRITQEFQPDLLHVHVTYPAAIIAYLLTRTHKIPYVITEHMSYLKDYTDKWQHRLLLKPALEQAAMVLPVSPFLAGQIQSFGWNTKIYPVANVVDTEAFLPQNIPHSGVQLLFAGALDETEIKGMQYLLPALAETLKELPGQEIHLHVVGDGSQRLYYEEMAKELQIAKHCSFYGRVTPEEMPGFYQRCDFFVLASLKETFSCVLIEAMACGKPVLATACGGPQSTVTEATGLLVESGSVEALTRGLLTMIGRYGEYNPQTIRQYVEDNFGPQAVADRLSGVYQTILLQKSVPR